MEKYFFDISIFEKIKKVLSYQSKYWEISKPRDKYSFKSQNRISGSNSIKFKDFELDYELESLGKMLLKRRSFLLNEFDKNASFDKLIYLLKTVFSPTNCKFVFGEEVPLFSYPTSGALNSITPFVYIDNMDEVKNGIYEVKYDGLEFKKSMNIIDLETFTPITSKNSDVQNNSFKKVNMIIMLCSNYENIFNKYGLLAYRLLHLEAGHIAQNIQLVSTALGIKSLPMGGWFDDKIETFINEISDKKNIYLYAIAVG